MPRFEVSRTLVKSPPELWEELGPDCFEKALGAVSVEETEPEREKTFSGEGIHGTAVLEPAGWGTKLTLTAEVQSEVEELEPEVARMGIWARLRRPRPPEPGTAPEPERNVDPQELEETLAQLLDDLGSAHKRPFQNG